MSETVKLIIELPKKTVAHIRSDYGHGYKGLLDEDREIIVNAIYKGHIPKGMTNVEAMKAVFPNVVIDRVSDKCPVAVIRIGKEEVFSCYKKWLDSPYKKGGEGDK